MPRFQVGNLSLVTDEDGFIQQPDRWNAEVAAALARADGIPELTEDHWKAVRYLRGYWEQYGSAPTVRNLVKATELPLRRIYELFPAGPAMGACKVAGLPKPTGCV